MTRKQREEYKLANQIRKQRIIKLAHTAHKSERSYWAKTIGVIQNGRHSQTQWNAGWRKPAMAARLLFDLITSGVPPNCKAAK